MFAWRLGEKLTLNGGIKKRAKFELFTSELVIAEAAEAT